MNRRYSYLLIFTTITIGLSGMPFIIGSKANASALLPGRSITATATPVPAKSEAEVERIDAYCDPFAQSITDDKEPSSVFAYVSEDQDKNPEWRKFASTKELEKFREDVAEAYFIAYNWTKDNKIAASSFTIFSGSGDWVKYVDSCYRDDGSLARVNISFSTFYGDFRMKKNVYFNQAGKTVAESEKYTDFDDNPITPDKSATSDNPVLLTDHFFKKVTELPYFKLTQEKNH